MPTNQTSKPHLATLVMLGVFLASGAIAVAWFAGQGNISMIFQQLEAIQENPPLWIQAPMMVGHYILFWTVALMLGVWLITKISPRPERWSRVIVIGILLMRSRCAPGELRSLWLLFRILLRPRVIFDRQPNVSAITVTQS